MLPDSIGFVGAGQMARALAAGFVASGLVAAERIAAADPSSEALSAFEKAVPGARRSASNASVAEACDVVFLATKPQQLGAAASELKGAVAGKLVISIAAGVKLSNLAASLGEARLVRVMPNMPCLVGQSASA